MNTWNINVIGDQSLEITDGKNYLYKERDCLSGEGVYAHATEYRIPTLNDLWDEMEKISPISVLCYSDFSISRYAQGFVYQHESGYKDIVSDATAKAQDLLSFLEMLDEIIINESGENGYIAEQKQLTSILSSLDNVMKPKENYDH